MRKLVRRSIALAIAMAFSTTSGWAELGKSGTYDVTYCSAGESTVISHSKDHIALTFRSFGTVRSNVPGGAFDGLSSECIGVVGIVKGEVSVTGYCEYVDVDGDRKFGVFSETPGQELGQWNGLSGTGKYAGIVDRGTYDMTDFPKIRTGRSQSCGRATGSYEFP